MRITDIKSCGKGLSQLYIDSEMSVKIDTQLLVQKNIVIGCDISDEELDEIIDASQIRRANEKALYLLQHRSHSKKELIAKISQSTGTPEAARAAAERMEELGLIDDREYGGNYAKMLISRKLYGIKRVRQELYLKGIAPEIIDEIVLKYREADPAIAMREILEKRYRGFRDDERIRRRAIAALQRNGYDFSDINKVMELEESP